jgi:hypothetical protein
MQYDTAKQIFPLRETLEVAQNTLQNMQSEQQRFRDEVTDHKKGERGVFMNTQQSLLHTEKQLHCQRIRLGSLMERLMNQINVVCLLYS